MSSALAVELVAGHPDTGPYDADDFIAHGQLHAVNRPARAGSETIRDYFLLERKGTPETMSLMGRLDIIAGSAVGAVDPLGDTVTITLVHITSAKTLLRIIDPSSSFSLDFSDSRLGALLDDIAATGAKVISAADKTAILAFSLNQQSRVTEMSLGKTRIGDIQRARA